MRKASHRGSKQQ